jgi:hypothetical protein
LEPKETQGNPSEPKTRPEAWFSRSHIRQIFRHHPYTIEINMVTDGLRIRRHPRFTGISKPSCDTRTGGTQGTQAVPPGALLPRRKGSQIRSKDL